LAGFELANLSTKGQHATSRPYIKNVYTMCMFQCITYIYTQA
jgi:hypothetical protein